MVRHTFLNHTLLSFWGPTMGRLVQLVLEVAFPNRIAVVICLEIVNVFIKIVILLLRRWRYCIRHALVGR